MDSIIGNFTGLGIDTIYMDPSPLSELSPKELKRKKVMFVDDKDVSAFLNNIVAPTINRLLRNEAILK